MFIQSLLACFASSVLCSVVIRARGGVRGHGIRQRLQVSQQHLKDWKVSSCRLGRFGMEMCRSGRFSAADLSACVSAGPISEPTLRRLASAVDVGTRVRKGKREQHHKHTARNTTRVLAKQCNAPPLYVASIPVWSEVENRQTSSDMSFLLLHEILQHAVPEGTEHDWVAAGASQVGFANVYVSGTHISEWTQHKGTGRACPFGETARHSLRTLRLTWRLLTGSHRNRYWIIAVDKRRLCALWVLRKTHHGRRFPGFWRGLSGFSFRGVTHGTTTRASLSRQVRGAARWRDKACASAGRASSRQATVLG